MTIRRDTARAPNLLIINNLPSFYRTSPFEALIGEFAARTHGHGRVAYQARRDPAYRAEWFFTPDEELPFEHAFISPSTRSANPFLAHSSRGSVRFLRSCRPTHVFAGGWDTPLSVAAAVHARASGARFVAWVESNDTTSRHQGVMARRFRRGFLSLSSAVVVPTEQSRQYVERLRGRPIPTSLLLNPVAMPRLPDSEDGLGRRMVFVGDFSLRKGFDRFLEAVSMGKSQGWRGVAWGRDVEGLAASGLPPNCDIRAAEPLAQIVPQLRSDDVWLIPSRLDPAPLIYSEALALGLRVVVSDEIGYSDHARRVAGAAVGSKSPESYLKAAVSLIARPRPAAHLGSQVTPEYWAAGVARLLLGA